MTRLLRSGDEAIMEFVLRPQIADVQRTPAAVVLIGAALLVLGSPEIGEHVIIRPAGIAQLPPQIEILFLAANVDEAIDRARSAEHFAARPNHTAAAELTKRLCFKLPGDFGVENIAVEPRRYVDPGIVIPAASFEHQNARRTVCG